ncbi:MAG: MaoC family dehydratase [Desulfobacteraceae bacterium]|jgi:3-hydroxybutyryl-CoA dehydratase
MIGKTIKELKVGDTAQIQKTISEADVYLYAGITGDLNPAHVNEEYAKNTFFKARIAHGMLVAGYISTVLGNKLPGPGSIYIHQIVNFLAPVYFGDTITAQVEVSEIDLKKNRAKLKTTCINQEGTLILDGEAIISPPKSAK